MRKLEPDFYLQTDVTQIARQLLGKVLHTWLQGQHCAGRIVETEAYAGATDRASHAYGQRRTARTEVMYAAGGTAYVYLCYGIHHLFNVVTHQAGTPHAVLIRAIEPLLGQDTMSRRRGMVATDVRLGRGPGSVAQALGIHTAHSGYSLLGHDIWIADDGHIYPDNAILATPRIGVDYAGDDALLPYRFIVKNSPSISGTKRQNSHA
ncbi:MAG: DNA-3-methyladenine glycosylase [Chitinophagaceae bacterium]|nr:DNA-3-methyladenine glycosylase [Chitinophagaceae bacterium]